MVFYTYKALQDELKAQSLPWTRTYLQPLENMGVISRPQNVLKFHRKTIGISKEDMRIYTDEEIQSIVEKVKAYRLGSSLK